MTPQACDWERKELHGSFAVMLDNFVVKEVGDLEEYKAWLRSRYPAILPLDERVGGGASAGGKHEPGVKASSIYTQRPMQVNME